jgi:valyl-tRNA synthetase
VIDPVELVERYGADAFRISILRQMRLEGQEIRYAESRCEEARNFNNKVWNATRYMLALPEGLPPALTLPAVTSLTFADRWILFRLHETVVQVGKLLDAFDMGNATESVWRFIWYEFCDWYVEATKAEHAHVSRAAVLSFVWNNAMRLLHPIAPFISEEVWLALPHDGQSVMTAAWPDPLEIPVDRDAARTFELVRRTAERLRNVRAETGLQPKERLMLDLPANLPDAIAGLLAHFATASVTRVGPAGNGVEETLAEVTARAPHAVLFERYKKDAQRLRNEVERLERKLENAAFVAKAAPNVVAKEREKLQGYRAEFARVEAALAALGEPA